MQNNSNLKKTDIQLTEGEKKVLDKIALKYKNLAEAISVKRIKKGLHLT